MSDYRLTARYGQQETFQTDLYCEDEIHHLQEEDSAIDTAADSELFERDWYYDWEVLHKSGVGCRLISLSANRTAVDLSQISSQPFLMQYGFVRFEANIIDIDGKRRTLYSKYCSALNSSDNENIENMIRSIMAVKEPVLSMLRWPSGSVGENCGQWKNESYSMLNGLSVQGDTPGGSPSSLSNIIAAYQRNAAYFRVKPEYTIRKSNVPVPFHRVRILPRDSMIWSVRTGNMHPLPDRCSAGIRIGNTSYMPRETLTETAERDFHIYENLVIIGFLDTVSRQLKSTEKSAELSGFHILQMILQPEVQDTSESLSIIDDIRKQYQHSLRLEERKIPKVLSLPKQTKRFQEIPPYHDIYQSIYEWFRGGTVFDWGAGAILKGRLADTIYEYFCWESLLKLFAKNGFEQYKRSVRTDYQGSRLKPPFSNIVFLSKGELRVTLYFNPWIPAAGQKPMHGISLVRTDTVILSKGCSPDFLIKLEKNGHAVYAVLDAKFRDMDRLFARYKPVDSQICAMEESLRKYYINLSDDHHLNRPINMVWLLQGRCISTDLESGADYVRCVSKDNPDAALSCYPKEYFSNLSWGAISLNAQNAEKWSEQFWEIFSSAMLPQ